MKILYFSNPELCQGLQCTVRRGRKWLACKIREIVSIHQTGSDTEITQARIIGLICCRMEDIPVEVLNFEHDSTCRNSQGLLDELRRVYDGFQQDEDVTIVFFYID